MSQTTFDLWDQELTEEETESILERAATAIRQRKLEVPAILMLEMHRPLANVGANFALAASPFLVPLVGFDALNDYSRVMQRPQNIERLIRKLEAPVPAAAGEGQS